LNPARRSAHVLTLARLSPPAIQLINFGASEVRRAASLKRGVNPFQCFALPVRSFELHFPRRNGLSLYTVRSGSKIAEQEKRQSDVVYEQRSPRF
jgi:hypothetical protein